MEYRFETFTVLVNRISRNIRRIKNLEMAEYGLRSAHVSCLYYLYSARGLTATDLCERCEEDKATISRALDYLHDNGYLDRQEDSRRYKSPLELTQKGMAVGKVIAEKINRVLDCVSSGLTEEERLAFYRSLTVISESLDAVAKRAGTETNCVYPESGVLPGVSEDYADKLSESAADWSTGA